jgi:membrane protein YqaA with SNARE-associated domain
MKVFKNLYNWTIVKSRHPKAILFLSLISFAESSFFPIPPDIILIPMVIANRIKAFFYALICTISSVLGGLLGYCIGYFFFNSFGILILNYYGLSDQFNNFEQYYAEYGIWIILGAGFTPFPFKFITIASGVFGFNIFIFICISFIARGFRFYLIAFLLKIFGERIEKVIDKYFNILLTVFFIILVGGTLILKFL